MSNYTKLIYQHINWLELDGYSTAVLSPDELDAKRDIVWKNLHDYLKENTKPKESFQLEVGISADPDIPLKYHVTANTQVFSPPKKNPEGQPTNRVSNAAVGVPRNPPPSPPGPPIIDSINLMPAPRILLNSRINTFFDDLGQKTIISQFNAENLK
jgi:hypothetical protein